MVAPTLLFDLSHYPTDADAAAIIIGMPVVYAVVVAAGILVSTRLARGPLGWLASSTTVALAAPRFFVYDVTFMMPALPAGRTEPHRPDHRAIPGPGDRQ